MLLCTVFTLIGLLFLFFYVRIRIKGCNIKALQLKTAVSCMFIAAALCAQSVSENGFGLFVLGGLVCGLMGDIWLDLKYVYPVSDEEYTRPGFYAFAAGHLLFIAGMLYRFGGMPVGSLALSAAVSIVMGCCTVLAGPLFKENYGIYKGISMFYGAFLFGTAVFGAVLSIRRGFADPALTMMLIGGILFALSDLVLGKTYFSEGHDRPVDIILNYMFYYGAQFVIAWSILFA